MWTEPPFALHQTHPIMPYLLTLLLLLSALPLAADTLTVTTPLDNRDGSLRYVLDSAEEGDVILFGAATDGVAIELEDELTVDVGVWIVGLDSSRTILRPSGAFRVMTVDIPKNPEFPDSTLPLRLEKITIEGGQTSGDGGGMRVERGRVLFDRCHLQNNRAGGSGGAVYAASRGEVGIYGSTVRMNRAAGYGGGVALSGVTDSRQQLFGVTFLENEAVGSAEANGGGLALLGSGEVEVIDSEFISNRSDHSGGGVYINTSARSDVMISQCEIMRNVAEGRSFGEGGGAVYNAGADLEVLETWIVDNSAIAGEGRGGGILNVEEGRLSVTEGNYIVGNRAALSGGGIEQDAGPQSLLLLSTPVLDSNSASDGGGLYIRSADTVTISRTIFGANSAVRRGGAIYHGSGILNVRSSTIADNVADGLGGGGIYNAGQRLDILDGLFLTNRATDAVGRGGAILNDTGGALTIRGTTFSGNIAMRSGGAIEDASGPETWTDLDDVTFEENRADGLAGIGGGVNVRDSSAVRIEKGRFTQNVALDGGGALSIDRGSLSIALAEIGNNRSEGTSGGGAVLSGTADVTITQTTLHRNSSTSDGGAIMAMEGTLTLTSSTLSGNTADSSGGGISTGAKTVIDASTIARNRAETGAGLHRLSSGSIALSNTIVAINGDAGQADLASEGDPIASLGYNLVGIATDDFLAEPTDLIGNRAFPLDPMLEPLRLRDSESLTHPLLCGSPARNAGTPGDNRRDQRGFEVFGDRRDIGAFELQDSCGDTGVEDEGWVVRLWLW